MYKVVTKKKKNLCITYFNKDVGRWKTRLGAFMGQNSERRLTRVAFELKQIHQYLIPNIFAIQSVHTNRGLKLKLL